MTARVLPPTEWARLRETELGPALVSLPPEATTVFVVEDDDGQIAGCWSLITFAHVEGLWIAPQHRQRGRVLYKLWAMMVDMARRRSIGAVFTRALTPEIEKWITKRGGEALPGKGFVLPLAAGRSIH